MLENTDSLASPLEPVDGGKKKRHASGACAPPAELRYRIRLPEEAGGASFDLPVGEHRVGSSSASDIRLAGEGISRQHALLRVTPTGLAVEDRGSKNGTFVAGRRVERAEVPPGSTLAFGPVAVEIEEVEAADVELALILDAPSGSAVLSGSRSERSLPGHGSTMPTGDTVSWRESSEAGVLESWLHLAEGFAEQLLAGPDRGPEAALDFLCRQLELEACHLVEWSPGDEPIALVASGAWGPEGLDLLVSSTEDWAVETAFSAGGGSTWTYSRLPVTDERFLGLVLRGEFPGRLASRLFLSLLLRLLAGNRPAAPSEPAGEPSPSPSELVFPVGYLSALSAPMIRLYDEMRVAIRSGAPILICGETGVGKERLASILHASSARADKPWVAINCAAIPSELLEAELFGIGKGVATGVDSRLGRVQMAEGGTLFLDEIGEMPPVLQAKLLRVLEEKEVQPLGGQPRTIDVNILAATNADLQGAMKEGRFRRDLFYRLAGFLLEVPPLRHCPEDIPRLIKFFAEEFAEEAEITLRGVTCKALSQFVAYPWPGNVRELRHEVRRLVHQCPDGGAISAGGLPARFSASVPETTHDAVDGADSLHLGTRLANLEARLIREALRRTGGHQVGAAELLGVSRNGLADKMRRLGIDPKPFRSRISP